MIVLVTLFAPHGLASLAERLPGWRRTKGYDIRAADRVPEA